MDLHVNYPYSLIRHGILNSFPSLDRNIKTDVAIIGAGITRALKQSFQQLFPHIPFQTYFQWSGAFGNSADGLTCIGTVPQYSNIYFALGYGGNGITFGLMAAQIITQTICGKKHPGLSVFSFKR